VIPEERKDNSYLYEPVASLAPMLLPDIMEEVENFEIPEDILDDFNNIKIENNNKIEKNSDSLDLKKQ
jgi:hypothetical protein